MTDASDKGTRLLDWINTVSGLSGRMDVWAED